MKIMLRCMFLGMIGLGFSLYLGALNLDNALYLDATTRAFSAANPLVARGSKAASMVYDAQGRTIYLPAVSVPFISVAAGKTLTLQNVTLVGFRPEHVNLRSAASRFLLGSGVVVSLDRDLDLKSSLTFVGNATIDGGGKVLNFNNKAALVVTSNTVLSLKDCTVKGIKNFKHYDGSNAASIMCSKDKGHIFLNSTKCFLDELWTFTSGQMSIGGDVSFASTWATFSYTTISNLTVYPRSSLSFERGMTFNYGSIAGPNKLILTDATSSLIFKNSIFLSGAQGINVTSGSLFIKGDVVFKNFVASPTAGITLDRSLFTALLAGSILSIDGIVAHGKPA